MRKFRSSLALLRIPLFLASFLPCPDAKAEHTLKIVTYNTMLVCVGPGCLLASEPNLDERALQIGEWLKLQKPDVVFLQEVFKKAHFEKIAMTSQMPFAWFLEPGSGLAILSRYPISNFKWFPYRWQAAYFQDCKRLFARLIIGVGTAEISLPEGRAVMLGSTHLLPRYGEVEGFSKPNDAHTPQRKANLLELADQISKEWKGRGGVPFILAGDFNMNQNSAEYLFFQRAAGLVDSFRTARDVRGNWAELCTYCADNQHVMRQGNEGEGILDYIFLSPNGFRTLSGSIVSTLDALSDHRPQVVSVQMTDKEPTFRFAPPKSELPELAESLSRVPISSFCRFAPLMGWTQRSKILNFINSELPTETAPATVKH